MKKLFNQVFWLYDSKRTTYRKRKMNKADEHKAIQNTLNMINAE